MKLSIRYGIIGISALAGLSMVHWARGYPPTLAHFVYFLGVLPNFLAAVAIPFVALGIWAEQNAGLGYPRAKRWFTIAITGSTCALLAWEFIQQRSRKLVFDPDDIGATILGACLAIALFHLVTPRDAKDQPAAPVI